MRLGGRKRCSLLLGILTLSRWGASNFPETALQFLHSLSSFEDSKGAMSHFVQSIFGIPQKYQESKGMRELHSQKSGGLYALRP
jgi:hypothetical protein